MRIVVNIDVPDLGAAEAFYCEALGLRANRRLDDDVSELEGGSPTIYLLQKVAGSRASSRATEKRHYDHWTPVHVDFAVEDVQAAAHRAKEAGAVQESECVEWRGSKCITFSDPFGSGFCSSSSTGHLGNDNQKGRHSVAGHSLVQNDR